MNNLTDINQVAEWFIDNCNDVTPKKLQKLLYYAYAWGLVFFNEDSDNLNVKLFDADFEAWVHGPVNRSIYAKYANYGYNEITVLEKNSEPITNEDVLDLLEQIKEVYGDFNGNELERLTHQEDPWRNARGNAKPLDSISVDLNDVDMFNYYGSKLKV